MLRLWGIWVIASVIAGLVLGWRGRAGAATAAGLACGACAFGLNVGMGDAAGSALWSMAAGGSGFIAGGLAGQGLAALWRRRR